VINLPSLSLLPEVSRCALLIKSFLNLLLFLCLPWRLICRDLRSQKKWFCFFFFCLSPFFFSLVIVGLSGIRFIFGGLQSGLFPCFPFIGYPTLVLSFLQLPLLPGFFGGFLFFSRNTPPRPDSSFLTYDITVRPSCAANLLD